MLSISKFCLFILFLILLKFPKKATSNLIPLVTGGFRCTDHEWAKYIVSIRYDEPLLAFGDNHFCGGAIISPTKILTAAHCFITRHKKDNPKSINVVTGSINRLEWTEHTQKYEVKSIIVHPEYVMDLSSGIIIADIAILVLTEKIPIDGKITGIVPLVTVTPDPGTSCIVLGWGNIYENGPMSNELLCTELYIYNTTRCLISNPGMTLCFICAADMNDDAKSACQGDSGGPFICYGHLTGVVSYGSGCGFYSMYADFYTDVACFHEWIIKNNAENLETCFKFFVTHFIFLKIVSFILTVN